MSVYSALRFLGVSYGWAGLGASALLTFYGFVTGFGASVFRAVFMVEVSCLAAYLGRSYDLLSALSLSLILQAWQSPYLLFSAGLQLSYGAVAAIGLETERLREVRKRRKEREEKEEKEEEEQEKEKKKEYEGLKHKEQENKEQKQCLEIERKGKKEKGRWNATYETLMLSTAIQLYTMPIQLYHYFTFPLLGIFLNLIVIPLLAYAAGSGLLALGIYSIAFVREKIGGIGGGSSVAGVFSTFGSAAAGISGASEIFRIAASACTGPGHYIFQLYEWLCIQVERLPFHSIVAGRPEMWKIGVFYVALGIRYGWSVGKAREVEDDLQRKGSFLFQKDWNAWGKETKEGAEMEMLEPGGLERYGLNENRLKGNVSEEKISEESMSEDRRLKQTISGEIVKGENGLKRYVIDIVFIVVAVSFLVFQPIHGFQIWFLDVGQGDGILLRTRDAAILSDCGSSQDKKIGKNVLEPFLKSQGIHTLDWILVSHADADHTNGIEWLLKEETDIRVRHLALPAAGKGQEAYEKLEQLARKRGAEVYYLHRGETVWAKRLSLRCMYPEAGEKPAKERNSHSLVFDVRYGKFSMLLTGDIGVEDESEIVMMEEGEKRENKAEREAGKAAENEGIHIFFGEKEENRGKIEKKKLLGSMDENEEYKEHTRKVTLLKAAHHGSNGSSSEEFLEYFSPAFTVLSYGEGNTYGHPAPEAVERLEQAGTEIWRTADSGAVNVWTDGKRMRIKGYKKQKGYKS